MNNIIFDEINDLNRILEEGIEFKVIRSHPTCNHHSIVLKTIDDKARYIIVGSPSSIIGELYASIIAENERKYENNNYLNIEDISKIIYAFKDKHPEYNFECIIGQSLNQIIKTENVCYYGKTYAESDVIYQFPGDMYMCMVYNECEPDKIYIMVGGLDKDDN